jgi:hypothetical protein
MQQFVLVLLNCSITMLAMFCRVFSFKSYDLVLNFSECDIIWKFKLQHCWRSSANKRFVNSLEDLHQNDTFIKDKCESCWGQLSNNRNGFIFYCFKLLLGPANKQSFGEWVFFPPSRANVTNFSTWPSNIIHDF